MGLVIGTLSLRNPRLPDLAPVDVVALATSVAKAAERDLPRRSA